jgi:hypothetical protein
MMKSNAAESAENTQLCAFAPLREISFFTSLDDVQTPLIL